MRALTKLVLAAAVAAASALPPMTDGAAARGAAAVAGGGGRMHAGGGRMHGFAVIQTRPSLALTRQIILNKGFFLPSISPFGQFGTRFGSFPGAVPTSFIGPFDGFGFGFGGGAAASPLPGVVVIGTGASGTLPVRNTHAPEDARMSVETTASGVQIVRGPGSQHTGP